MKTFKAYRVDDSNSGEPEGFIWFDGERLQSTAPRLKRFVLMQAGTEDQEDAWIQIPHLFKGPYRSLSKTTVDENGKEVKQ